jgi:UDP-3-O-[3-hydroxymyristoyl] N-acetylglucosamine deacetylase
LQKQRTIAGKASCAGIGLHSGQEARLTLRPARADTGIVFLRRGLSGAIEIPARPSAVCSTANATCLAGPPPAGTPIEAGWTERHGVATVEHLMAALHAARIDNLIVEVDGPEVPALDGSALPFVKLLNAADIFEQNAQRACLRIDRPIEVIDGERSARIEPAAHFEIDCEIDFEHSTIGRQRFEVPQLDPEFFEREIAGARTFGFFDEAEVLWQNGLARGGSLENIIVLGEEGVMNPEGLRWPDEFVRHKVLDLIGDLALLGIPIRGRVRVRRGGHSLHHRLIRAIQENPDAWCVVAGKEVPSRSASEPSRDRSLRLGV